MTCTTLKKFTILSLVMFTFQLFPFSYVIVAASEENEVDEELITTFQRNQETLLNAAQKSLNAETNSEDRQEFTFDVNTFQTTVEQAMIVSFKSKLPADQVMVRIPSGGRVVESLLNTGETIEHSNGEYWLLKKNEKKSTFELPVIFDEVGKYFITIDHDADHFYLEVKEQEIENKINDTKEFDEKNSPEANGESQLLDSEMKDPIEYELGYESGHIQPILAKEEQLNIPQELINLEQKRILEETLDPNNRTASFVSNWSQFRSAWNSSSTTSINMTSNINFSSSILGSSLNSRSNSIFVSGPNNVLNMGNSGNSLVMTNSDMRLGATVTTDNSGTEALIRNTGGSVETNGYGEIINKRNSAALSLSNAQVTIIGGKVYNEQAISPVSLTNSSITIREHSYIGSQAVSQNWIPPISSNANSNIYIQSNNVMMRGRMQIPTVPGIIVRFLDDFAQSWNRVDAHLTGVNGGIINSSSSNPNDFSQRYLFHYSTSNYRSIVTGAGSSDGFNPPVSYTLSLQSSPDVGGNPSATNTTLTQGSTTTLNANPNSGYRFVRWEVVSGTGSSITNATSATTTFTMGSANTTVRAVYEESTYNLTLQASPSVGGNPSATNTTLTQGSTTTLTANPNSGYRFVRWEVVSGTGSSITNVTSTTTTFTMGNTDTTVQAVYERITQVSPVDPLDPEVDVIPENKPELPEDQGQLSIDFVSSFNFGIQAISAHDRTYYAQPQRLLNEDGTVNEMEKRPNYVQISDRRPETDRYGWQLSVTQRGEFEGTDGQVLAGARLRLMNQQVASAQGGDEPHLQQTNPLTLVPNVRRVLLYAQEDEGTGTWVYRFGNSETAGESVALDVPKGANPEATHYNAALLWELSAVPEN